MTIGLYPTIPDGDLGALTKRVYDLETLRFNDSVVNNGDFETWNANGDVPSDWGTFWTSGNPVVSKDESVFKTGGRSARITMDTSDDLKRLESSEFRVAQGDIVQIRAWARSSVVANSRHDLVLITNTIDNAPTYFQTGASVAASQTITLNTNNTWQELQVTFVVPAGHVRAKVFLSAWLAVNGATFVNWDSASVRVVSASMISDIADTGWITPTLTGGFTQYGAPWGTTPPVGYRRKNGIVYGQGLIIGPLTTTAFTLPTGFRPNRNLIRSAVAGDVASEVRIGADGTVQWTTGNPASWASLGDMGPFPADA